MKYSLAAVSILLLGCQTQAEPTQAEPTQAEPTQTEPAQAKPAQAKQDAHLSRAGLVRGDTGEALPPSALPQSWRKQVVHLSYERGTTFRALLKEVLVHALEAESRALVVHAPGSDLETRIDIVQDTPGIQVNYATLYLRRSGPSFGSQALTDDAACVKAISTQREAWRGKGELAILLNVVPANQEQPLQDLQRVAALVVEAGCRPVLHAGHCAYAIERQRFDQAMAAETVDGRLRLLRAHIKAYPKPVRTSVGYLPFAWEWKGEIYVGQEWTEWTHVRTGETTKPKFRQQDD